MLSFIIKSQISVFNNYSLMVLVMVALRGLIITLRINGHHKLYDFDDNYVSGTNYYDSKIFNQ